MATAGCAPSPTTVVALAVPTSDRPAIRANAVTGPAIVWAGTAAFDAAGARENVRSCVSVATMTESPSIETARATPAKTPIVASGPPRGATAAGRAGAYARTPSCDTGNAVTFAGAGSVPTTRSSPNARMPRAMTSFARCGWVHSYGSPRAGGQDVRLGGVILFTH